MVTARTQTMTRRTFLAVVSSAAVGLAAACGQAQSSDQPQAPGQPQANTSSRTLVFWHSYTQKARTDYMQQLTDRFAKANPGVTVSIEVVPFPAFPQKWPAAQAGRALPDVSIAVAEDAINMYTAGALYPMDDVLNDLGGASAFLPGLLDKMSKYQDHYVLLPHYVHDRILIYRKDRLQAAGVDMTPFTSDQVTWDDALKAATATNQPPDHYGWILQLSKSDVAAGYLLWILTRASDGHFWDQDGNVTFDSAPVREAVSYLAEIGRKASPPDAVNYNINDNFNLVQGGKTTLAYDAAAVVATALQQQPDVGNQLDVTFMPKKTQVGNLVGAVNLVLPRGHNQADAKNFVKFLFSEENYVPFLHTIPLFMFPSLAKATTKFLDEPTISQHRKIADITLKGVQDGSGPGFDFGPNPWAGPAFASHQVELMMQSILLQNTPVEQAVADTARQLGQVISGVKSKLKQ